MAETDVLERPSAATALGLSPSAGGDMEVREPWRGLPAGTDPQSLRQAEPYRGLPEGTDPQSLQQPLAGGGGPLDLPPEAGMVIKVIRAAEGTAAGSGNVLYGGAQFTPGTEHPADMGWQGGRGPDGRPTHAAGPGQWQPKTWGIEKARAAQQGIDLDFSNPQHQNWAMWDRAQDAYKRATGRDLAADVKEGKADYRALGGEWQGLLKNGGQPTLRQWANGYSPALQARADALTAEARRMSDQYHDSANELMRRASEAPTGSRERDAAIKELRERERDYLTKYEEISKQPPVMKPVEAMEQFGSLGFIMSGLMALGSRRHMTAALGAMGKAMQAANQNRYEEFQREYKTWEQQSTTALNMVKLHNEEIRNLIDDKKMSVDEKNTELRFRFEALGMQRQADQMALGASEKVFAEQASFERMEQAASRNAQSIKMSVAANLEAKYISEGMDPTEAKTRALREAGMIPGGAQSTESKGREAAIQKAVEGDVAEFKSQNPNATPAEIDKARHDAELARRREMRDTTASGAAGERLKREDDLYSKLVTEWQEKQRAAGKPDTVTPSDEARLRAQAHASVSGRGQTQMEPTLDDATLSRMADQYLAGDYKIVQGLGYGNAGAANRAALQNRISQRAQQMAEELGIPPERIGEFLAIKSAEYAGVVAGERTLGVRTAQLGLAAQEALLLMPAVLKASENVPRTELTDLNRILIAGETRTGDQNTIRLGIAVNSLINVYARAISPTGVPTVSDKEHARELLQPYWSKGQIKAGLDQLKIEIDAAVKAPAHVRQEFREGAGTRTPSAQPQSQVAPSTPPQPAAAPSGPPVVSDQAAYDALPSGSVFTAPDGKQYRKP